MKASTKPCIELYWVWVTLCAQYKRELGNLACTHNYIHTTYIRTHAHINRSARGIYVCVYIGTYVHIHARIEMHRYIYIHIYIHRRTCTHTLCDAYIHMYIYIHTPTKYYSNVYMYIYIYIYMHTYVSNANRYKYYFDAHLRCQPRFTAVCA
jgi:hypothetical protein